MAQGVLLAIDIEGMFAQASRAYVADGINFRNFRKDLETVIKLVFIRGTNLTKVFQNWKDNHIEEVRACVNRLGVSPNAGMWPCPASY